MILIDLRKAFDAINHEIFPQRLKTIRYSKGVDTIFPSEYFLLVLKVSPQVLENLLWNTARLYLLFLIYVSNMAQAVKSTLLLYADDS